MLRDDDDGTAAPQPVAADLPALFAESATAASINVDCDSLDLGQVPTDTGRALYRIVQEGLTNARKHAPGSAVDVTLTGTPAEGLSLAITSWLPVGRAARPAPPGSGTGLIGVRERAVLCGGRIDAAVTDNDRFQLLAWLPTTWSTGPSVPGPTATWSRTPRPPTSSAPSAPSPPGTGSCRQP